MDTKILNTQKNELLDKQEQMLRAATESGTKIVDADWDSISNRLDEININLARAAAVEKGKAEVSTPRETPIVTDSAKAKFFALGVSRSTTPLPSVTADYVKQFWASMTDPQSFSRFMISNASLGEAGTTAAGGALVPVATDPSIPMLAVEECTARQLSKVITTQTNLNLPYQSGLTTAALKAESNSSGTNPFATNAPTFATTLLTAYQIGDSVTASWELLQDSKAASDFISTDIQRAIVTKEENLYINGTGTNQPQGYLGNATTAVGSAITSGAGALSAANIIDVMGTLNKAYYSNAKWLVNRQEFNRLFKVQIAASQFQQFIQWSDTGAAKLFGYDVAFSGEMPVYIASPATNGSWLFGNFAAYAVIGDRGDSNIRVQVNPYSQMANGQTVIYGYRRADQRILVSQAAVQFNTSS